MKRYLGDRALAVWLAVCALAIGGCGQSSNITGSGAAAQQLQADDTAIQTGAAASSDNGGMMAELAGASQAVPMAQRSGGVLGVSSADTTFSRGNVTITLGRTFFDAGGNELQQWDPSATRVRIDSWIRGSVTGLGYQATFGRTGVLDIDGLAPAADTLVFSGTATDTTDATFTSIEGMRTVDVHALGNRALTAIKKLKDSNINPWPLSGSATWNLAVDKYAAGPGGSIQVHWDATAVLTFNGTRFASLLVNGRYHYVVDLQTGIVTRSPAT